MMLPDKDPAESVVLEFDFAGELSAIDSAVVSITAVNGIDGSAAAMLDGSVQIAGTSVYQRVKSGLDKVNYKPRCVATQGAEIRVLAAILPVRTA